MNLGTSFLKDLTSPSLYFPWHEELSSEKQNYFLLQCTGNHKRLLVVFLAVSADKIYLLKTFFFEATQSLFRLDTCVNSKLSNAASNCISTSLPVINCGK